MLLKRFRAFIFLSVFFLCLSVVAILSIPLVKTDGGFALYFVAGLFWLGFAGNQLFFWLCNATRKKMEKKLRKRKSNVLTGRAGIISVMKCPEGVAADVGLIISFVATVLLFICHAKNQWLICLSVALLFASLHLHCLLNGVNYLYIRAYRKYLRNEELEKNEQ